MSVTVHSDRGDRPCQEDAYLVPAASTDSPVVAVFDGMGGAAGGATASALALEELSASWEASALPGLCDRLEAAAHAANARVYERQRRDRNLAGMGTTLVAAAWRVHPELGLIAAVVAVGDSRAYLVRAGKSIRSRATIPSSPMASRTGGSSRRTPRGILGATCSRAR